MKTATIESSKFKSIEYIYNETSGLQKDDFNKKNFFDSYINVFKKNQIESDSKCIDSENIDSTSSFDTFGDIKKYELEIKELSKTLSNELYQALKKAKDFDQYREAEDILINIEKKYSFNIMGTVVQNIFSEHSGEVIPMSILCDCLCRYDYREVIPWGSTFVAALINNKSTIILEHLASLIDSWCDKELLNIISNISIKEKWLQNYFEKIKKRMV